MESTQGWESRSPKSFRRRLSNESSSSVHLTNCWKPLPRSPSDLRPIYCAGGKSGPLFPDFSWPRSTMRLELGKNGPRSPTRLATFALKSDRLLGRRYPRRPDVLPMLSDPVACNRTLSSSKALFIRNPGSTNPLTVSETYPDPIAGRPVRKQRQTCRSWGNRQRSRQPQVWRSCKQASAQTLGLPASCSETSNLPPTRLSGMVEP